VLLSISSVSLSYRHLSVLEDVTLTLSAGTTALLGVNGAGKTSLFKAACGVHRPTTGEVRINGLDPYARATRSKALAHVALVPQFLEFPRHLKVIDFLEYMALIRGVSSRGRTAVCLSALAAVDLTDKRNDRLGALSGGMLKRVSIAQALLTAPPVLLCDEPTAGLDPEQRASIRALLRQLASERCLVVASHIVEDAQYVADRVVVLHGHGIAFDGSVDALVSSVGSLDDGLAEGSSLEQGFLAIVRGTHR
jgi:ABC-2 type transport system ATP-binding protein